MNLKGSGNANETDCRQADGMLSSYVRYVMFCGDECCEKDGFLHSVAALLCRIITFLYEGVLICPAGKMHMTSTSAKNKAHHKRVVSFAIQHELLIYCNKHCPSSNKLYPERSSLLF